MNHVYRAFVIIIASSMAGPATAGAERRSLVDVSAFAGYHSLPGSVQGGVAGARTRAFAGSGLSYGLGLDLAAGAGSEGVTYQAEALPVGLGLRLGRSSVVSLVGGVGTSGGAGIDPALQLPLELGLRGQLGPVRVMAWASSRWIAFADARQRDRVAGIDELELGLGVGLGAQKSYWPGSSAGSGAYVGFAYRELGAGRSVVVSLGINLTGAN